MHIVEGPRGIRTSAIWLKQTRDNITISHTDSVGTTITLDPKKPTEVPALLPWCKRAKRRDNVIEIQDPAPGTEVLALVLTADEHGRHIFAQVDATIVREEPAEAEAGAEAETGAEGDAPTTRGGPKSTTPRRRSGRGKGGSPSK